MGLLDSVRKNRGHASDILAKAVQNSTVKKQDDSLYYPERDSTGSASVIIRFLPQKNTDAVPFISKYNHIFKLKNSNKWLWEACPTTVGKDCPFCERNSKLFTSGNSNMVQVARERKRKKEYYANILVIKDPKSPEKEGRVFIYRFGQSIMDFLTNAISPKYEDEPKFNPFDLWEGADFYLRIRRDEVKKQVTYADSKFATPSELFPDDDAKKEAVLEQCYDLSEKCLKNLKSYSELDEMAKPLYRDWFPDDMEHEECSNMHTEPEPRPSANTEPKPSVPWKDEPEEHGTMDDTLSEFRKLVNEIK